VATRGGDARSLQDGSPAFAAGDGGVVLLDAGRVSVVTQDAVLTERL